LRRALIVGGAIVASGMVASGPAQAQPASGVRAALAAIVDAPGGPPGAAAIVHRGRHPVFHTVGVANVRTGARWAPTDHMRLASTSKAFNGATALALVRRHKLHLRDTIGELLPSLPRAWRKVTLAEALQHTSGLPSFTKSKGFLNVLRHHPAKRLHPLDLIGFVRKDGLDFKPGTDYDYSNTDNVVAGLMVEAVTGKSYVHEMRRLVLRPLGLDDTSLPAGVNLPDPFARGYDLGAGAPQDISRLISSSATWAAGGMVSTPQDLDRFIRADVGGRFAGGKVRHHQLTFVRGGSEPPGPGRMGAGLAIFRYRTPCGTVYGHTGNFPGYTQLAVATRDGRDSATLSLNTQLDVSTGSPEAYKAFHRATTALACAILR
jgi:D-alanyl-D-alanine carboxypeptidase